VLKIHKQVLAEQDIIDIWIYSFENWGRAQADKYLDELDSAFSLIAKNPSIGVASDSVREDYRKYHVNRHIVMYRLSKSTVHIIRVLGEEMDYETRF
jgi:toxin ParE1/3/4